MSNIVQMFHDHRTNSCYNHRAHTQVKGSLESAGTVNLAEPFFNLKARLKVTESSRSTASQPSYYGLDILLTFWLHSSMRCTCLILFLWPGSPQGSFEVRIWTLFVDLQLPRMLSRFQIRKMAVLKRLIEGWNCRFVSTRRGNQVWNLFICAFSRKGNFLRKENQRRIDWIQLNSI